MYVGYYCFEVIGIGYVELGLLLVLVECGVGIDVVGFFVDGGGYLVGQGFQLVLFGQCW